MDGGDAERTAGNGAIGARRIPAQSFEARRTAEALLAGAEEEARRIRGAAEQEVSAARGEAVRSGHAEGLAAAAAEVCRAAVERDRMLSGCRDELLALAVEMAARILVREVRAGEDALGAAERALAELRGARRVTLRACPADAGAIREGRAWPGRAEAWVRVVVDPALGSGEVVVEADGALVDGRFRAQLAELRRAIAAGAGAER